MWQVRFTAHTITWDEYSYPPATVAPTGELRAADIREANPAGYPPHVVTLHGETLFLPRGEHAALAAFCAGNGIPARARADIWSMLLEPFLDTVVTADDLARIQKRLYAAGLGPDDVAAIRARVGPLVDAYNSLVWDWVDLNLTDLLNARYGPIVAPELRATLGDPNEFYWWAMRIADQNAGHGIGR